MGFPTIKLILIVIEGFTIRQDAEGRYCLNDLHKASGNEEKDSPSRFSRTEKYNELLTELTRQNWRVKPSIWLDTLQNRELVEELIAGIPAIKRCSLSSITPVFTIKVGIVQGTFVCKELVYAYAVMKLSN